MTTNVKISAIANAAELSPEYLPTAVVRRHELLQRRRPVSELPNRPLELRQQIVQTARFAQVAVAATRPRTPFTNRPASSPEKVFASSIDSLMAALVGTLRSTAIS